MLEILLLIILILLLVISALPMHLAVLVMGGRSTIIRVIFANFLAGIITFMIYYLLDSWAGLISFVLMIWVYKEIFNIGFVRAVLAWILQFIIAILLIILATAIFGASFLAILI